MRFTDLFGSRASNNPPPTFNDFAHFESLWDANKDKASRRLGTYEELEKTISELSRYDRFSRNEGVLYSHSRTDDIREIIKGHRDRMNTPAQNDVVGDPNDVHYVIPPKHTFGYAIEEGQNGYVLETIEMRATAVYVLRQNGRIVAVMEAVMGRMESYNGVHVI